MNAEAEAEVVALCDFCDTAQDELGTVTVADESGEVTANICPDCRTMAATARCAFCGQLKTASEPDGAVTLDSGEEVEICGYCRYKVTGWFDVKDGGGA
jgi:hypothetical protein